MIESLLLENFKRHTHTELTLSRFTLLVGPNGTGKTSVLEALHLLSGLDRPEGPTLRPGFSPSFVARRQADVDTFSLAVRGRSRGEPRALTLHLTLLRDHALWNSRAEVLGGSVIGGSGDYPDFDLPQVGPEGYWPELHRAAFLRLDARRIALATEASLASHLEPDGAPLATVLANRKLADDPSVGRVLDALRRLVPEFRSLRVIPAAVGTKKERRAGYRLEFDTDSGEAIAADDMSEGTLVLLALLSVLYAPERPRLLLLDAIDSHLHPTAQAEVVKLLRSLIEADEKLQVIASTHSPYIVDAVDPSAVLVFAKGAEGRVGVRPLSEHPDGKRLHGRLSSGQLWTLDDEQDWVFGAST